MFSNLRGNYLFGDCVRKLVARVYICSGTFLDGRVNVSKSLWDRLDSNLLLLLFLKKIFWNKWRFIYGWNLRLSVKEEKIDGFENPLCFDFDNIGTHIYGMKYEMQKLYLINADFQ